jgi:hypothetical protein
MAPGDGRSDAEHTRCYRTDETLAYARQAYAFQPGERLTFDESYRLGHLPLVAKDHPAALHSVEHLDYHGGRYATPRHSLVAPVEAAELAASLPFQALERDLRGRSFGHRIEWGLAARRAPKLHVTIVGGLREAELKWAASVVADQIERSGPLRYRLGGPFVGQKNRGRIYFKAYPEQTQDGDVFARVQSCLQHPLTSLYLLGYYNLAAELGVDETSELAAFLETWGGQTMAELTAPHLALLATHDDLALDSRVVARLGPRSRA